MTDAIVERLRRLEARVSDVEAVVEGVLFDSAPPGRLEEQHARFRARVREAQARRGGNA